MELQEYHALGRVEREHWFYRGKRALAIWWIDRAAALQPDDTILDAGAGTGELVSQLMANYESREVRVVGIEFEREARRIAAESKGVTLVAGSILALPLPDASVKVAIAMDVLEHVEDDVKALAELLRVTEPMGIVIINVPAFMSLWSEWDVTLGHFRRYTKKSFRQLLFKQTATFETLYFGYTNGFAFGPILIYRKIAKLFKFQSRAEDKIPSTWLNELLYRLYIRPAQRPRSRALFGSSLFCVIRKTQ